MMRRWEKVWPSLEVLASTPPKSKDTWEEDGVLLQDTMWDLHHVHGTRQVRERAANKVRPSRGLLVPRRRPVVGTRLPTLTPTSNARRYPSRLSNRLLFLGQGE